MNIKKDSVFWVKVTESLLCPNSHPETFIY